MELVKLDLISKNNKQNGFYLYSPIVRMGNDFYRCETIKSQKIINKAELSTNFLKPTTLILPEFWEANDLKL